MKPDTRRYRFPRINRINTEASVWLRAARGPRLSEGVFKRGARSALSQGYENIQQGGGEDRNGQTREGWARAISSR